MDLNRTVDGKLSADSEWRRLSRMCATRELAEEVRMPWIDAEEHPDFNLTEEEARGLASTGSGHGVVVVAVVPTRVVLIVQI